MLALTYKKGGESYRYPSRYLRPSHCPSLPERATQKSHTVLYNSTLQSLTMPQHTPYNNIGVATTRYGVIVNHIPRTSTVALILAVIEICEVSDSQRQSACKRLSCILKNSHPCPNPKRTAHGVEIAAKLQSFPHFANKLSIKCTKSETIYI